MLQVRTVVVRMFWAVDAGADADDRRDTEDRLGLRAPRSRRRQGQYTLKAGRPETKRLVELWNATSDCVPLHGWRPTRHTFF